MAVQKDRKSRSRRGHRRSHDALTKPALSVDPLNMPKPAVDAFVSTFMRKVRVLPGLPNSQCYVEKIAN